MRLRARPTGLRRLRCGARLVVAGLVATVAAACGTTSGAPPAPSADVGTRLDGQVSRPVLELPLRDSQGHLHRLAEFKGRVLVISDVMTLCQESCPVDTAGVTQTARAVERAGLGNRVEFLTITVDPDRDTPSRLAAYQRLYAPVPRNWMTLTGSPAQIQQLWKYLGVYTERVPEPKPAATDWLTGKPLGYDVDHSDEVFFISADGHERFILEGIPHIDHRSQVPDRIYRFMDARGHHNVNNPDASNWTVPQALQVLGWLLGKQVT